MSKPDQRHDTHTPGHLGNQGQPSRETRKPDAEEQQQRRKDQAPQDEDATSGRSKQKERLRQVLR